MDIQLVVFDIAGTTVKDNGEIAIAFKTAMQEFGYEIPIEKINPLMGYKKPEAIKLMLEAYDCDISVINVEFINTIHHRFAELMVNFYKESTDITPLPNAEEVFSFLKENNIKVGLDTGFSREITEVIIDKLGWFRDGKIDCFVCSDEVKNGRPAPDMIHKLMELTRVTDAKKVVKIGDTEVDVNEGKNAECLYSIGVTTGAFTREELKPYQPDFIIDDLVELITILKG